MIVWTIIKNLICLFFLIVLICFLLSFLMYQMCLVRNRSQEDGIGQKNPDEMKDPEYRQVYIEAVKGGKWFLEQNPEIIKLESFDKLKLNGYLLKTDENNKRFLICVHGHRANGFADFGQRIEFLASLGWNILLVDDRAHGMSEGKYIGFSNLDGLDVLEWSKYLIKNYGEDITIVLHGISMGAATIMSAAGNPDAPSQIKGIIPDCGFSSGWDEACVQSHDMFHVPIFPFVHMVNLWTKLLNGFDLKDRAPKDLIKNFKGKLLLIHGGADDYVPTWMSQTIYDAAQCEKDIQIFDGARHVLSYSIDTERYQKLIKEFLNKV